MVFFMTLLVAFSILPVLLCQKCGEVIEITPPRTSFRSPRYPFKYPNDMECKWRVSVEESCQIHIQFTAFEFDGTNSCSDYLEMWDGRNKRAQLLFKSCAQSLEDFQNEYGESASFNSSENVLFLMMTTDDKQPRGRGFLATYNCIPALATTTVAIVASTAPDDKRSTVEQESTTKVEISTTTPLALSSLSTTVKSIPAIPTNTLKSVPTDFSTTIQTNPSTTSQASFSNIPSLQPTPPSSSSSRSVIVVVPTVSLVLLLSICVTGFVIHKKSSKGKSKTSLNNRSIHGVGTSPIRTIKEQSEPYSPTLYYNNESFHASPEGLYPPPYQRKNDVDDMKSSQMNTRILPSEGVIGTVAYESCDGEEKRNVDYTANAEEVTNIAYESYDGEKITGNSDNVSNVGEVGNIAYESYDGQENVDNGDYTANVGEVSNIAYQSYDGQGKVENDDIVLHEGETSNVVYESYDRHENSSNSDDTAKGEVSNVAYESYDGENNVTYDTDEVSREYQTIHDNQSVDDDYSKIRY